MPYERDVDDEPEVLLYEVPLDGLSYELLVTLPEGRVVPSGFLWFAVVRVTVLFTGFSTAAAECLSAAEFAAVVVTLLAVVLPLETADTLTLPAEAD